MLTYFPLIVGKCDFIAPDCLPLCLAAVCNEVEGRNDISKHCQRHNRPECWVQLGQSNFFRSYQLQNLNRTSDFDEHRLSRWYALRKYSLPVVFASWEASSGVLASPQLAGEEESPLPDILRCRSIKLLPHRHLKIIIAEWLTTVVTLATRI